MSRLGVWLENRFGGKAAFYERIAGQLERAGMKRLRAQLAGELQGEIIEIGCGTGLNFSHYPAGSHVTAVERVPEFRDFANQRATAAAAQIDIQDGDAQVLGFADARFDAALVTLVFCSIPDPRRALRELRRVVRPGGRVFIFEHVRSSHRIVGWIQDLLNPVWRRTMDGCNLNRDAVSLIQEAGFEVERVASYEFGGLLFPMREVRARA